jgi:hypothetical protein
MDMGHRVVKQSCTIVTPALQVLEDSTEISYHSKRACKSKHYGIIMSYNYTLRMKLVAVQALRY